MRKRRLWLAATIVGVVVVASGAIAAAERQNIFDWLRLRDYQPPATVQQLASETTMNAYARKFFYVNHPVIDTKASFNKACPNNGGEKTVVLGCYHTGQQGIFILNVSDPHLQGVEQVTAAHEMLHAAYDRLSAGDKKYVDGLLMNYYEHDLHDKRLLATIAAYKQSEPHDVVNEMHSVFGTEVAHLPAPLENYYKRYFTDRQKIAAFAAQYQGAFTSRQRQVEQDDAALSKQKQQITGDEASLQTQLQTITSDQNRLNVLKGKSDYGDYNAAVPAFNTEVNSYNSFVAVVKNLISEYNQFVQKRNAIALEENQLTQAISSAPAKIAP